MKTIWDRFHVWLAVNAPQVLVSLNPPATAEQIRAAEQTLGITLPDDVRAAYLVHNGENRWAPNGSPGFLYGWIWLSLERMVESWSVLKGLLDRGTFAGVSSQQHRSIRRDWWHPRWIPLAEDGCGDLRCLDLAPAGWGKVGQVIAWHHDYEGRSVVTRSFTRWLAQFADELEAGTYGCHPDYMGLATRDDLLPGEDFTRP